MNRAGSDAWNLLPRRGRSARGRIPTRRASEGRQAFPSLARRVGICDLLPYRRNNTVATTRDAGAEIQLPAVWVAREGCRKAFCTDRDWSARQRRRYAPRDMRPLPPRRWEFRGCHPGPRVGAGRARTVSGSRLRAVRKRSFQKVPRGRNDETWSTSKARNRRAVQPREQTSISWISQGMDHRSQSWPATRPCPVNPGLPGREDAATKCK